jgi:putative hydrolase of the HAD superfamily
LRSSCCPATIPGPVDRIERMDPITVPTSAGFRESLAVRRSVRQTLMIDADDTLWENNIYFERAISSFISYLDHRVHTNEEVRERLNLCERATIAAHGYGLKSFRRSLTECFEQLSDGPITPEKHARIVSFTEAIAQQEIELLAGVEETLRELGGRHRLILVTKGNSEEQHDKVERSGLRELFAAVEVPHEKTAGMYRDRQFTTFGHQSGAGCGPWRGVYSARLYLGAGTRGGRGPARSGPAAGTQWLPGIAPILLGCFGLRLVLVDSGLYLAVFYEARAKHSR